MHVLRKAAYWILGIAALLLAVNFGANYWVRKKLPGIIQGEKDFPYNISYEDMDLNLLSGSFTMHNMFIAPKDSIAVAVKNGVFGKVGSLQVRGLKLWQLYRHNRIIVSSITITKPEVIMYHRDKKYSVESDLEKPFRQVVQTREVTIREGNFRMLDKDMNPRIKAANISLDIFNIRVDSATVDDKIPVRYRDYRMSCDSLFYNAGVHYNIALNHITTTDSTIVADKLRLIPKQTRVQYTRMIDKEKDQYNISIKKIEVPKADWGFFRDTLYVHAGEAVLDGVNANVYRSKEPADDPTRKKLYSELLRNMKFDLKLEKLKIKNSSVTYEEQLTFARPAAKLRLTRLFATVHNLYSPINKTRVPQTAIDVECLFMQHAPLTVHWTFNTMNTTDAFTIQGVLRNVSSEKVNPVSKPLMNAETNGDIKEVRFTLNGNREGGSGPFAIHYDDLKVDIYKKDGKKKNKLMTALGNLVVKNDTNGGLKETQITVARSKDKSVFNFLWKFLQEGLKQTVLPKIVSKSI